MPPRLVTRNNPGEIGTLRVVGGFYDTKFVLTVRNRSCEDGGSNSRKAESKNNFNLH